MSSEEKLTVSKLRQLLDIPRSTFYHRPKPISDEELTLMQLIDECDLKLPFYGTRRVCNWLFDTNGAVMAKCEVRKGVHQSL